MPSAKTLHHLATHPHAHLRFLATGRLPRTTTPASPLIALLTRISPRDRTAIRGLTVGPALGYGGRRRFDTAEQALRWLRPDSEMIEGSFWPAESWRLKQFQAALSIEQLLEHATSFPPDLAVRYLTLRRQEA